MNTCDPMDRNVYRHVAQRPDFARRPGPGTRDVTRLPTGYANGSPATYLARRRRGGEAA